MPSTVHGGRSQVRWAVVSLLSEADLAIFPLSLPPQDLVLLRHHLEASEGLGFVVARRGGDVLVAGPRDRAHDLEAFLVDMSHEFRVHFVETAAHQEARAVASRETCPEGGDASRITERGSHVGV